MYKLPLIIIQNRLKMCKLIYTKTQKQQNYHIGALNYVQYLSGEGSAAGADFWNRPIICPEITTVSSE